LLKQLLQQASARNFWNVFFCFNNYFNCHGPAAASTAPNKSSACNTFNKFFFFCFIPNSALPTNSQEWFTAILSSNLQAIFFFSIFVFCKT
jgi:hypothetical protein